MVKIIIENPVWSKVIEGHDVVQSCLSYIKTIYIQKQFRKEAVDKRESFLMAKGLFYTGFVSKIEAYCKKQKIPFSKKTKMDFQLSPENEPRVEGAVLDKGKYAFQSELIKKAIENQRGVILSATASGKTVMMLGLISCFPSSKTLFLSDSKTPIMNFKKAIKDFNIDASNIHMSTIHSVFKKPENFNDFDIILIDECHSGMGSEKGMYKKFLTKTIAPIRLGFSGTLPDKDLSKLILEGLLGPVIGTFTIQEGMDLNVLTRPKIIVRMVPKNSTLRNLTGYNTVYKAGIVENRGFNLAVVDDVKKNLDNNESNLVLVTEIQHGKNIVEMAKRVHNMNLIFANGKTEDSVRIEVARALGEKEIDGVVATTIFRKALNVPSLDNVYLAYDGKGSSGLLQAIGRGLRSKEGKIETKIYDYFNPNHRYFVDHFGHRLCIYFQEGWM